jgi:3-isopropylmalate/(R)-2-methylmalate dehydratase large subunit
VKIPRKKELLELQKKYHTDKKIGEVYGVPGRLVAYWRSKKSIGPFNQPKYTREKILDLWERYGDDRLAGAELGISGPGFRQWRLRYGIKNKPAQLKMEQLELDFIDLPATGKSLRRETTVRKLLARKAGLKTVEVGETIPIEPDLALAVDNANLIIDTFFKNGFSKVCNQAKIAIVLNQPLLAHSSNTGDDHKKIREFIKKQGILNFYDIGWGISQQVAVEEGLILPGQFVVGSDRHASSYGCIGAFSKEINIKTMAEVWATGKIKLKVPASIRVIINGRLPRGVTTGDIILKLARDINRLSAGNKVIEFHGRTVAEMSIPQRITLTNFAVDAGAVSAIVPFDETLQKFLKKITKVKYKAVRADLDAQYDNEIEFDISFLTPLITDSGNFHEIKQVEDLAGKRIDQVVMGGCNNGSLEDLEIAAAILRGRRIHRNTRMLVMPGSRKTYLDAIDRGYISILMESGCVILNPSHNTCYNACFGMLAKGERALATTCGNMQGKKRNPDDPVIFIASPATAAASALEGIITDPRKYIR